MHSELQANLSTQQSKIGEFQALLDKYIFQTLQVIKPL